MVARASAPIRSANAGEFSPDAKGRVDIKQYYSAGLAYKNVEPVPQSGFRQMGGSRRISIWRRPLAEVPITNETKSIGPHTGTATVWIGDIEGPVAAVYVNALTASSGSATFIVEARAGGVWVKVGGGVFTVPAGASSSRLAACAPSEQIDATQLRVRATFSDTATISLAGVQAFYEGGLAVRPRFVELTTDVGSSIVGLASAGIVDFFDTTGHLGAARLPGLTAGRLPDLDFYAEANTIGVAHPSTFRTKRLLLMSASLADWRVDDWPFESIPEADLGGVYPTTADIWDIMISRIADPSYIAVSVTVNGEMSEAVWIPNAAGDPANIDPETPNWPLFVTRLEAAVRALPTLNNDVTLTMHQEVGLVVVLRLTFGGSLAGEEYEVTALVTNTSDAAALATHSQRGKTDLEPLFSTTHGWPGTFGFYQDRLGYARIPAVTGAVALSRIGEYFDLNVKATADNAARLDKLRSLTTETVLHLKESKYLLAFTDRGAYFVNNRTIERNTPLNFILASETGAQPNCKPFDLEGEVYYVSINPGGLDQKDSGGHQLLSIIYDDVSTSYNANPESLLASHLMRGVIRTARQRATGDLDAAKGWLMRADGRLIAAQIIRNQDITGFCEWMPADGGQVREIGVDGRNRLWLAVERDDRKSIEVYDPALYLQDTVSAVPDLAGVVTGLPFKNGVTLWAVADGFVVGPLTCNGGAVDLQDSYASAIVGRWQAPRWESMPQVFVTPGDDVILRPGRIHTAQLNVIDTTSLAIGANGEPAEDVSLYDMSDPADAPLPAKTRLVTVGGLAGFMEGTTLVVTQTKPGTLRVRDLAIGAKL